jgi:hypothetical protein
LLVFIYSRGEEAGGTLNKIRNSREYDLVGLDLGGFL